MLDRELIALCQSLALDESRLKHIVAVPRTHRIDSERMHRLLAHLLEHQIHHRDQAHAMLAGTTVRPPQLEEFYCVNDAPLRAEDFRVLGFSEAAIWQADPTRE